ncbi:MAG: glycerol kinase GlpK [Bacteroidetes bacterium]|nr:glycerol kinase GlpK [Bacteroidota bacterium]
MEKKYVMAIDQGTTGTRVILFNRDGTIQTSRYLEIKQIYPHPGWVEHDPMEYLSTVRNCSEQLFNEEGIDSGEIASIGITNQRETTILWEKRTGNPIYNAIVWQCRRSAKICDQLKDFGYEPLIKKKTGLVIDAYFSSTKIMWLMENIPGLKERMESGEILMGNIDSWLIWNLSGGKYHVTDFSNASRTMLFNIYSKEWDDELLKITGIPKNILPEVKPSSGVLAVTEKNHFFKHAIPIAGVAGDQHAATFGQGCFKAGMVKNTYGTALALFMNTGTEPIVSKHGLTTNLGWHIDNTSEYALEGVVFIGGAAIQWLRDGLRVIKKSAEVDLLAERVDNTGGVYFVPAFTGLCAPYWDMYARGLMIGMTGGTSLEHIARAALESMAYQTRDVLDAMVKDFGQDCSSLRVDGGAAKSDFLMQFQADVLGIVVERPKVTEMAARGAAYLAGLGTGFWKSKEEIGTHWKLDRAFEPSISEDQRESLYSGWQKAVQRSLNWAEK